MSQSPLGRQRSVLVVGSGLTAAATAGFLEQAGLDPVVASTSAGKTTTGETVLWRPGLVLLERIGLRRPIERLGTRLASRHCLRADRSWTADSGDRPSLLAIDDERLRELIEQYVLTGGRVIDRTVTAVEPTDGGVRATFEGVVTEPFDAVVTTTQSLRSERPEASTAVHSWRFRWPAALPEPPGPAEAWAERRVALFVPASECFHVRLVSTADVDAAAALSLGELERRFGRLVEFPLTAADRPSTADQPCGPFAALDQRELRYSQSRLQTPTTIADDGIVRVGSAARGSAPGDPLAAALGIEDGWVLADALAYGPDGVGAALADYERRRRCREGAIAAAVGEQAEVCPADRSAPLRHLAARRRLAFGHVHDGQPHPLAESIPQRL
jgi:2-polyprenyl-6-methoxyphenol hydroxylase-like FAD-dependent oxidoreductase